MKKIVFIIPPSVELLDIAGLVQVFTEAKFYGFEISTLRINIFTNILNIYKYEKH